MENSSTAISHKIDNTIKDAEVRANYILLIEKLLDPIREKYGKSIRVTSGYRCREVNRIIGGAQNSQHQGVNGAAADLVAGNTRDNRDLFSLIVKMQKSGEISFDQLINERKNYSWIHISYNKDHNRNQVLAI